jgi:hypothetical protein
LYDLYRATEPASPDYHYLRASVDSYLHQPLPLHPHFVHSLTEFSVHGGFGCVSLAVNRVVSIRLERGGIMMDAGGGSVGLFGVRNGDIVKQ